MPHMSRPVIAATINRLASATPDHLVNRLTEAAVTAGLMWWCPCQASNHLSATKCTACGAVRLWGEDVTPGGTAYGALLEDLRAALMDWFDDRPRVRRPAAVSFRVTDQFDDGPAWATFDATFFYTDHAKGFATPLGLPDAPDFDRTRVADALNELSDEDTPNSGQTLRVALPV